MNRSTAVAHIYGLIIKRKPFVNSKKLHDYVFRRPPKAVILSDTAPIRYSDSEFGQPGTHSGRKTSLIVQLAAKQSLVKSRLK